MHDLYNMRPGIFMVPNVNRLNEQLATGGLKCQVVVAGCNAGMNFGRRKPEDVMTAEHEAEWLEQLRNSTKIVTNVMGLPLMPDGLPRLTAVGFSEKPHHIPLPQLIQSTQGPGFLIGDNPHPECLALVSDADLSVGLALATPFADAPAVYLVYVGTDAEGKMFVITASIMATWHRLSAPDNLVQRTLTGIAVKVAQRGGVYDVRNVWAFVSPAASDGFHFGGTRAEKLSKAHRDQFVYTELIPREEDEKNQGTPHPDPAFAGWVFMNMLNLRGWVASLLRQAGVPDDQVAVVDHDTVKSTCYTSKRARLGRKVAADLPYRAIPSNALVGTVTALG